MTYDELKQECTKPLAIEGTVSRPSGTPQIIVGGMGGSALPANALRFLDATLPIQNHRDYDLPEDAPTDALYIAISYSGNTAEAISFAEVAHERGLALAIIDSGGELLNFAKKKSIPFVKVQSGIQPRNALFYSARALAELIGKENLVAPLADISFDANAVEQEAQKLADTLANTLPIFYASRKNGFLAYVSKIHCNETAKMPAYANVFPEMNHNEMQSFDSMAPEGVTALTRFVLLRDENDDPRIKKRMDVFSQLMRKRDRSITEIALAGESRAEQLARTWFFMHRTAVALAKARNVDPDEVSLVEEFKKLL